jgi:hypothetical protein
VAHIFAANLVEHLRGALSGESMVISKLNRSLAKQDPEGTFENPLLIVEDAMFTRGEKMGTLDRWRQSILAELAAVGEVKRARLPSEIDEARNRLRR